MPGSGNVQSGPLAPRVLLDTEQLDRTVSRLAAELGDRDRGDTVIVGVLKGSATFVSDLVRAVPFHPRIDFVAVSTFSSDRRARLLKDIELDVSGADVVIVQDIVDTGLSLHYLLGEVARHHPRSVSVCALVDKPQRRLLPVTIDHVGIVSSDDYVIGYGLDFAGRYRNVDVLAVADLEALALDPDCYYHWAYGNGIEAGEDIPSSG